MSLIIVTRYVKIESDSNPQKVLFFKFELILNPITTIQICFRVQRNSILKNLRSVALPISDYVLVAAVIILININVLISLCIDLAGSAATYIRFFPYVKKNYDYGVVIFLLTFNLITVSSFRVSNVLKIAHQRFYTIAIGCGVCLLMSLLVFPIWSGEDLHNSTVSKLEGLAKSIEGMVQNFIFNPMYLHFKFM